MRGRCEGDEGEGATTPLEEIRFLRGEHRGGGNVGDDVGPLWYDGTQTECFPLLPIYHSHGVRQVRQDPLFECNLLKFGPNICSITILQIAGVNDLQPKLSRASIQLSGGLLAQIVHSIHRKAEADGPHAWMYRAQLIVDPVHPINNVDVGHIRGEGSRCTHVANGCRSSVGTPVYPASVNEVGARGRLGEASQALTHKGSCWVVPDIGE